MSRLCVLLALALAGLCHSAARADTYTVTLDPAARTEPATGRIILFFITGSSGRWVQTAPMEGPFFERPQPIASVAVTDLKPGESVTIDGSALAFPTGLDQLAGSVRVQAILDADQTERSHAAGPGNVHSDVVEVELAADRNDAVKLSLTHRIDPPPPRADSLNLKWVKLRSELLSTFHGRDIFLRAGVALPKGYTIPNFPRREWPAIYVVPGFGGREEGAEEYASMLMTGGVEEIAPMAVHIVLDPELPLGHHGFADSANNGPVGAALVKELIPHLESQFRLVARPEARLVTGHSSGGWSSLWLQLTYPDTFGGCWSSAPDPIDFSAFQMTDLYADANVYRDALGTPTPSFRRAINSRNEQAVAMTVRQEGLMEHAIDPLGRSGQQWDAWEAMFSPRDVKTCLPQPMFDPLTGAIDKAVVEQWKLYDMTRMVRDNWERYGPIVKSKVHLACGDEDNFYLNRAVERFGAAVKELNGGPLPAGAGYVLIVERANHGTLSSKIFQRWNQEMREHLMRHGVQDLELPPAKIR